MKEEPPQVAPQS